MTKTRVQIVFRNNTTDGLRKLPAKINAVGPRFILSLHCDAFNKVAKGTETLFFHTSTNGKKLAKNLQTQLFNALELKNRGIRDKKEADRRARPTRNCSRERKCGPTSTRDMAISKKLLWFVSDMGYFDFFRANRRFADYN